MDREKIKKLIDEALAEDAAMFLVDWKIDDENGIHVVLDHDNGLTVDDLVRVSRAIEHRLDRDEEDFSLDILSAGADSPLSCARQYVKNTGRDLKVKTVSGEELEGLLEEADNEKIVLRWSAREPKPVGKGKHTVEHVRELPYAQIKEARVQLRF